MEPLTPSELRALYILARFETAVEAAEFTHLSPQTIRNQSYRAFKKLGVNGRLEAFRKLGWLRPPRFMPSPDDAEMRFIEGPSRTADPDPIELLEGDPNVKVLSRYRGEQLTRPNIEVFYRQNGREGLRPER
jgi:DNA-binding CsgD family transcriptional regulator